MLIRAATPEDIDSMFAMERDASSASHWPIENYRQIVAGEGPPRLALVAEDASSITGFLVAQTIAGEWEIENVVVSKPNQRRGVASALVKGVIADADRAGTSKISLEVRESNISARNLYEKVGFREAAKRSGYYHAPADSAVIYILYLHQVEKIDPNSATTE